MFTRYSGVDIPQNYSGNRFRKKSIENTEMKVHTNQTQGAIKSSVSPSFENQFKDEKFQSINEEISLDNSKITEAVAENEYFEGEIIDSDDSHEQIDVNLILQESNEQSSKPVNKSILGDLSLSPITEYLKSIKGEDLLLIALIIFLASDKNVSNNDILIILALLLVYHT